MRRRRRYSYGYDRGYREGSENIILLAEFRFYNNKKNVINDEIIVDIMKKLEKKDTIYWTNTGFVKKGIGFKFFKEIYKVGEKEKDEYNIQLLDFKNEIRVADFVNSKKIYDGRLMIHYDMTPEQEELIRNSLFNGVSLKEYPVAVIKSWEEFVQYLVVNDMIKFYDKMDKDDWEPYKNEMKILFNIDLEKQLQYHQYNDVRGRAELYHLIHIHEMRINEVNYRILFKAYLDGYSIYWKIGVIKEDSIYYNQCDKGRLYFTGDRGDEKKHYFIPEELNEFNNKGHLLINAGLYYQMTQNITELLLKDECVITPNIYRFYKERVMSYEFDDEDDLTLHEKAIVNRYIQLIKEDKEVKVNQVLINRQKISVDNGYFTLTFCRGFINVTEVFTKLKSMMNNNDIRYNFNTLYEHILKLSKIKIVNRDYTKSRGYQKFGGTSFQVNEVKVHVYKDGNRMKINGIFSRIDDVMYIVAKAVCFKTTEEFDAYVKEVSFIGVEWKKMISNGILIQLSNPLNDMYAKIGLDNVGEMLMRFSLVWGLERRNEVFLVLNNNKYLIKYKAKFKRKFDSPRMNLSITELKRILDECLEYLDEDVILEIVDNAIEEAKIIKARGEELVKETIVETSAEETELEIKGNKIKGFIVVGLKTKTKYFIDKSSLSVYRLQGGNWNRRCVVDSYSKERIFEDRLANRLVNIANEPKKIYTLFD